MRSYHVGLTATLLVTVACAGSPGQVHTIGSSQACVDGEMKNQRARQVRYTGELTRKGSDVDSWWALRIGSGKVYRLQFATESIEKLFMQWQNRRVTVVGMPSGKFLSFDLICVHRVSLATADSEPHTPDR